MEDSLPKNLEDCLNIMARIESSDEAKWLNLKEKSAMTAAHHGFGTDLRNALNLWDPDTELSKYFRSIGIVHGDDKSGIIMTSYHRFKNGLPLDLEGQLKKYWKHWKEYADELTPPNIEGVDPKYLELFNNM